MTDASGGGQLYYQSNRADSIKLSDLVLDEFGDIGCIVA